jgi:predicted enzyme related to lactoylglutathione lyase
MAIRARYVHTNIVARDWKSLARFYEEVFGCTVVPPERNLSGPWVERATGVPGARMQGVHLRLPGSGNEGPTLEIFQYSREEERPPTAINRPGLAHIAFLVEDVRAAKEAVMAAGGGVVGEIVLVPIPPSGTVEFVYLTDPEGNIIELQRWSPL